jgi:hypothetical protein
LQLSRGGPKRVPFGAPERNPRGTHPKFDTLQALFGYPTELLCSPSWAIIQDASQTHKTVWVGLAEISQPVVVNLIREPSGFRFPYLVVQGEEPVDDFAIHTVKLLIFDS